MLRRALPLLIAAALPFLAVACGSGDDGSSSITRIAQMRADVVPSEILGLSVKREDVRSRMDDVQRPYVEATGLYSLRKGKELQATLQVSQFNDKADVTDPAFRLAIVNQIGSTAPRAFRMGSHTVYLTSAKRQAVAVFFERHSFAVLSTLDTFDQSRTLLRRLLELDL